ncbi:helix-turn-helix domain-containing protein [Paraburkholderia domus]|jgi:Predicted transcriptional regulators|uniref:helix-turn-helix domain-containing protein n=1 Tax=Paraburkholderia domus TaxID=2793075 RepID=UPI001914A67A|nr:helix-turn-helix transcriptional regulator [Paraburkholderia domus]
MGQQHLKLTKFQFVDYIPWTKSLGIVTLRYMKQRDYETLRRHLAINIKAFRREHELSQEGLSLEADVDRTYVSQIERSLGNPSLLILAALASALGRDVGELLSPPSPRPRGK